MCYYRVMSKLYIANWKSNKNRKEAQTWIKQFIDEVKPGLAVGKITDKIVVAPPFPFLQDLLAAIDSANLDKYIHLAVQDISPYEAGSYTGAVSAMNLEGFNVKYAIVGHSERRKYFRETSEDVANKVESCMTGEITPVVCVDLPEVEKQAKLIDSKFHSKTIVAYEPVEHIGTGIAQPLDEILDAIKRIKNHFPSSKTIYGGSVNLDNVEAMKQEQAIEGFLVGSTSLKADAFAQLI